MRAFWNKHHRGCNEHLLVQKLRDSEDLLRVVIFRLSLPANLKLIPAKPRLFVSQNPQVKPNLLPFQIPVLIAAGIKADQGEESFTAGHG